MPIPSIDAVELAIAQDELLVLVLAAVVPGAKPLIERDQAIAAIVHFEILVMQVVYEGMTGEHGLVRELELFEADMAIDGAEPGYMQLEQADDRI